MKRAAAFYIDMMIIMPFLIIPRIFCENITFLLNRVYTLIQIIGVSYSYFLLNDFLLNGYTLGKKVMKTEIRLKMNKGKYAILHATCKILFLIIWPVSFVIYTINNFKMPYDDFFYTGNEEAL